MSTIRAMRRYRIREVKQTFIVVDVRNHETLQSKSSFTNLRILYPRKQSRAIAFKRACKKQSEKSINKQNRSTNEMS